MRNRLLIGCISLLFLGCYEPEEGCLDPLAKNYDVTADDPGPCTYPDLVFDVQQVFDSLTFVPGRSFAARGADSVKIDTLQCLLSGIVLKDPDGQSSEVTDRRTISVDRGMGVMTVDVRDDIILFQQTQSGYTIGSFPLPGKYDALQVQTGLPGEWQGVLLDQLPNGHPLRLAPKIAPDSSDAAQGYLSMRIFRDTTRRRFRARLDFESPVMEFDRTSPLVIDAGMDAEIRLELDYAEWIDPVDWANDSEAEIINTLEERFTSSFQWLDE